MTAQQTVELIVILFVGLLFFGPKRLPEIGNALGKSINEFRRGQADKGGTDVHLADRTEQIPPAPVERDVRDVRDVSPATSTQQDRDAS